MFSSRLFWKVFLVYAGLNIAFAVLLVVFVRYTYESQLQSEFEESLHDAAVLLRDSAAANIDAVDHAPLAATLRHMADETHSALRFTVVNASGQVIADSHEDAAKMENHLRRPEITAALRGKTGTSQRYSATVGESMYYLALPIQKQGKIVGAMRVSDDMASIDRKSRSARTALTVLAFCVGVASLGLTYYVVGRIIRPLAELTAGAEAIAQGDYQRKVLVATEDEIGTLAAAFNRMREELAARIEELGQQNERLTTVLGSMVEGVLAVDAQQRVLFANKASKTLLHLVTPDLVGRPLLEATRSRPLYDAVLEAFSSRGPCKTEFEVPDALRRTLMLQATRLPGKPCPGVVVVLHDVTELRRLENLRREFVANVSHELKTPLASIKAYAETLLMGALEDAGHNRQFVKRIEEQAERLHQLIVDMLQIARVESHQAAFEIVQMPLQDAVELCCSMLEETAKAKGIALRLEPPAEPTSVLADVEGLQTILGNLVDNAIKYTPSGGAVTVRWWGEQSAAIVQVQDNGLGIAPEDQARVFERFYRVDKARSREMGGTGLGLSIVKHLVQAFSGSVRVRSELGKGSTFEVRLPRANEV